MATKSRTNTFTEVPWSHEWSRNAEAKRRQVEALNQNDAIIGLMTGQNSLLATSLTPSTR